jgi:alpha-beta hydrolase superfamily lysophospholipase
MIRHGEGSFVGFEGARLFYQSGCPSGEPRAILAIVHGLGGHSGLFDKIVKFLVPKNYAVYSLDLRGHGRSPGQRGHINHWSEFREDLAAFLRAIQAQQPGCRCFLLGHSLGATIVLDYALRFPTQVSGMVAIAPALGEVGISPVKLLVARLLSQLCPRFTLSTGIDLEAGSRDPQVLAAYDRDPLRHTQGSARLATEFFRATQGIWAGAKELHVPLLILHGGCDRVTSLKESRRFFEQVAFVDKEMKEYPKAYHDLHNDLDYLQVLADLGDWLDRHLQAQG